MENKSVPRLYLIGAQKAGTTSLSEDLMTFLGAQPPSKVNGHGGGREFHFFEPYQDPPPDREQWLAEMPGCQEADRFVADMTPKNLRITCNVPAALKAFYGVDLLKQLNFVLLIRDPLSRYQSAYYHGRMNGWPWSTSATFNEQIEDDLSAASPTSEYPADLEGLSGSIYAPQLAAFVDVASPSQFAIFPMKAYLADRFGTLRAIAWQLGKVQLPEFKVPSTQLNPREHPSVAEDVNASTKAKYDRYMAKWNDDLFRLLWDMSRDGAYFHVSRDCTSDKQSFTDCITALW